MKFNSALFDSKQGQTLIEAVVALAAILVAVVAIAVVISASISNATYVKNQNLANKYAQDALEYIRGVKDNNGSVYINCPDGDISQCTPENAANYFQIPEETFCMGSNNILMSGSGSSCVADSNNGLKRDIHFERNKCGSLYDTPLPGQELGTEIIVTVSWPGGNCPSGSTYCHKAEVVSCIKDPSPSERAL